MLITIQTAAVILSLLIRFRLTLLLRITFFLSGIGKRSPRCDVEHDITTASRASPTPFARNLTVYPLQIRTIVNLSAIVPLELWRRPPEGSEKQENLINKRYLRLCVRNSDL